MSTLRAHDRESMAQGLAAEAHSLGFDLVAMVPADSPSTYGQYRAWVEQGYQGGMGYLARPDAVAGARVRFHANSKSPAVTGFPSLQRTSSRR